MTETPVKTATSKNRLHALRKRFVIYPLEGLVVNLAYAFFAALPIDRASDLGGWLGRTFGPRLGITERAVLNLERAFPEKRAPEIQAIVRAMWDNLGRVLAEFPHLGEIRLCGKDRRVEVTGLENFDRLRTDGRPGIFFSAHFGNWEVAPLAATQRGLPLGQIYRSANNRMIDRLIRRARSGIDGELIPKGAEGARKAIATMNAGGHLAMVVDQKMNDGIAVPFFGRQAMTAPALAQLALKFDCPVVPVRVERLGGCRFRMTFFPPMEIGSTGDRKADVVRIMTRVNALIEGWIRARPEQWLWLHRRWPE